MAQASKIGGLDEALETLAELPYGSWLLMIVTLGLMAYGVYMVVQAGYRHLNPNM